MSYELRNNLHGFTHWFSDGGWIVLLIVVIILCLIAVAIHKS